MNYLGQSIAVTINLKDTAQNAWWVDNTIETRNVCHSWLSLMLFQACVMFFSMKLQLRQLKASNLKKDTISPWKYPKSGELTRIALKGKFSSELRCCLASEHMEYSRQFIWTHFILLLWCIYVIVLSLNRAFFRSSPFMLHIINKVICIWSIIRVSIWW